MAVTKKINGSLVATGYIKGRQFQPTTTGLTGLTGGGATKLDGLDATLYSSGDTITFKIGDLLYEYRISDVGALPAEVSPQIIRPDVASGTKFWALSTVFDDDASAIVLSGALTFISGFGGNGATLNIYPGETVQFDGGFYYAPTAPGTNIILRATAATDVTLPVSGTIYGTTTDSITSDQLRGSISDNTGTGGGLVFATSPTLTTPALGAATATSIAIGGATIGSNALAVTGSINQTGALTSSGIIQSNSYFTSAAGGWFLWASRSAISSPANGNVLLQNAAASDFGLLQFGGTTSSFPALKRSSTSISARLADDSADASLTALNVTTSGDLICSTVAKGLQLKSGTGQRTGNATLVAGTITVTNTSVTANTVIALTRKTSGGTLGTAITYTLSAGASFTITSDSALDTSVFSYLLIELNP